MRGLFAQTVLAVPVWFMLGGISFAMCIWFAPPSRQFEPATNMKTLISRSENTLTMTVQPQFSGDATSFALVIPFPAQPLVSEAPEAIFDQLEDATNPLQEFDDFVVTEIQPRAAEAEQGVTVIEERDVGDYSTVTLSANDEEALREWLDSQGYEITDQKQDIISQYVQDSGYFVALQVNMEAVDLDEWGYLNGELNPISFTFESAETVLPLRLMAGDSSLVTLTVYALADELTYIPGAQIQYSKKVDAAVIGEAPALEEYDAWQKWLVRNEIQILSNEIESDLQLLTTREERVVVPGERPLIINPDKLPLGTGVIVSEDGLTVYDSEDDSSGSSAEQTPSNNLTNAAVGILAVTNIILLGLLMMSHNAGTASSKK